ncbi:MAG: GNAT family N-acetyltransferase, partial [Oscillospiraceae bacterium]
IYRKLNKTDFPAVKDLINESFGMHRYMTDQGVLNSCLNAYLQNCLSEATFTSVVEKDGVLIGVIMGKANSDYRVMPHLKALLSLGYHSTCMKLKSLLAHCNSSDYKKMNQAYHELSRDCNRKFDGVLTLFIITKSCRGLGVGKELLHRLLEYQKKHGVTSGYLYTDTSCNIGFYEHQGFERLGERIVQMRKDGAKTKLGVYLYGYVID